MNTSAGATAPELSTSHPLDDAEKALGGRKELAEALGVTVGAVGNWKARGVPIKACVQIERLVPNVTRALLRPDDYMEVWPELTCQSAHAFSEMPAAVRVAIAAG